MPHVLIYLHFLRSLSILHGGSASTTLFRHQNGMAAIAMTIAGFVNLAMMATAAAARSTFLVILLLPILMRLYLTLQPLLSMRGNGLGLSTVARLSQRWWGRWRAGSDAGLHSLSYPAVGASYSHHAAVIYRHFDGIRIRHGFWL